MLNMKKVLIKMLKGDFVVEEGTEGIWTYRKWASGLAECWGKTPSGSKTFNTQKGSSYYASKISASYPSGLFVGWPDAQMTLYGAGTLLGFIAISTNNATTIEGYPCAPNNTTQSVFVYISAKGTWK